MAGIQGFLRHSAEHWEFLQGYLLVAYIPLNIQEVLDSMRGLKCIWEMQDGYRSMQLSGKHNYIDASHIRLGENANYRPVKMELLDYTLNRKRIKNLYLILLAEY